MLTLSSSLRKVGGIVIYFLLDQQVRPHKIHLQIGQLSVVEGWFFGLPVVGHLELYVHSIMCSTAGHNFLISQCMNSQLMM